MGEGGIDLYFLCEGVIPCDFVFEVSFEFGRFAAKDVEFFHFVGMGRAFTDGALGVNFGQSFRSRRIAYS